MYLKSILIYLIWPLLISITYIVLKFVLKKFEKREHQRNYMNEMPV